MRKILIIFFIFFSFYSYSQEMRVSGHTGYERIIEINSGFYNFSLLPYEKKYNNYEIAFHKGLLKGLGYEKINVGIGLGCLYNCSFSKSIYGKFNTDYFFRRFRVSTGIFTDYFFNNNSAFSGIDFSYYIRLINLKSMIIRTHIRTEFGYNSFFDSPLLNFSVGLNIDNPIYYKKPVLYFYTEDTIHAKIKLKINGDLLFSWPTYKDGWDITILPDNEIIDNSDNKKYCYLFWEGKYSRIDTKNITNGFYVSKDTLPSFFENTLLKIGLNTKEINDFITYWVPLLQKEKYLIHFFIDDECNIISDYEFSFQPKTFIRIMAVFIDAQNIGNNLKQQTFVIKERVGFTAVEWGGAEY